MQNTNNMSFNLFLLIMFTVGLIMLAVGLILEPSNGAGNPCPRNSICISHDPAAPSSWDCYSTNDKMTCLAHPVN